jgi:hypothetical protein
LKKKPEKTGAQEAGRLEGEKEILEPWKERRVEFVVPKSENATDAQIEYWEEAMANDYSEFVKNLKEMAEVPKYKREEYQYLQEVPGP